MESTYDVELQKMIDGEAPRLKAAESTDFCTFWRRYRRWIILAFSIAERFLPKPLADILRELVNVLDKLCPPDKAG